MTFFNKKEEVLDIQLTQLGKYLLSKGKFKPVFYTFSDDEILYNRNFSLGSPMTLKKTFIENDKQANDRIQKETPRTRTFYNHDGVETNVYVMNGHDITKRRAIDFTANKSGFIQELPLDGLYGDDNINEEYMGADDRNLIRNFLGTSEVTNQNVPNWNISILNDEKFTGNLVVSSSLTNPNVTRPILEINLDCEIVISDSEQTANFPYESQYGVQDIIYFEDGKKIDINTKEIILSIIEENVDYTKENFTCTFFEIEDEIDPPAGNDPNYTAHKIEVLKPLFLPASDEEYTYQDPEKLDTFFEVSADREILSSLEFASIGDNGLFGLDPKLLKDQFKKAFEEAKQAEANLRQDIVELPEEFDDEDFCE